MHLKVSHNQFLLHLWIKQSLNFLAVKFEEQGSFLLRDMGVVVTLCSILRCVGQQLTYKLGDLFMF